ncbi:putative aldouronate transport system substrate-binding protein [Paenibacillus sp. UNCCL117]|uniref:ABC transporter substrate-binding protein n=1 Tax=unclassified Paenibacillus TaxID=185978 RepID=UPI0008872359|nr:MULTISPECIES: ABC transporter substrate-binding protein [unclassified Paenibacillus]SDD05051.1 putative aldouronate transport system substrate-binding protein [Paenibacillus sp. cl123]SFW31949.1 putative aldouronate transport system substrate-binding protein [Paenibacillus sp. UNCCL117]
MKGMKSMNGMRKKMQVGIMPILALSMLASACSGNTETQSTSSPGVSTSAKPSESATKIDTTKPVKLKLVLVGTKPPDTDEVYAEVNKILKQKINTELEIRYLDLNEYNKKYPLLFAANEDFDMIFASSWTFYNETSRKDGFLELTEDLLKTYAPNTWKNQNPIGWEQAKINGKIYMVPQDTFSSGFQVGLIRGDLREKYNLPEVKTQTDLVNYLTTIAKNEKSLTAFGGPPATLSAVPVPIFFLDMELRFLHGAVPLAYDINNTKPKLTNYLENPKTLEKMNLFYEMAQQGVWTKDAIVSKTDWKKAFEEGKTAAYFHNIATVAVLMDGVLRTHPEWKPELIDVNPTAKQFQVPLINGGIGIHATSKHAERALMALDLLRYDKDLYDLTFYGIKGKHWEPVGDKKFRSLPASANYPPEGSSPWGWRTPLSRQVEGLTGDLVESVYSRWKSGNIIHSPLETFALDDSKIKNELAALNNVTQTYLLPIYHGLVKPEEGLPQVLEKMKQAGLDKVQAEFQAQLDAYIASKK